MPKVKRRFFKRTKTQENSDNEIVKKEQKSKEEFKKIESISKKEKPPKKNTHFPKISRVIPEVASKPQLPRLNRLSNKLKWGIFFVLVVIGLVFNFFVGSMLYKSFISWSKFLSQRQKITEKMQLWENITKEYPNYRDAYIEGALYAYQLGDRKKENYFLSNLQFLDPNFPSVKSLQQLIDLQQQK